MALSHSPRSDCEEGQKTRVRLETLGLEVSVLTREQSYWDVLRKPLRDVQVVDLHGDFLAVTRFGHTDGGQVLQTRE